MWRVCRCHNKRVMLTEFLCKVMCLYIAAVSGICNEALAHDF